MTILEQYRHDIVINPVCLEMFVANLLEENFNNGEEAFKWLDEQFVPVFTGTLGDMYGDGEEPTIPL